jgi:hypothetical protein
MGLLVYLILLKDYFITGVDALGVSVSKLVTITGKSTPIGFCYKKPEYLLLVLMAKYLVALNHHIRIIRYLNMQFH